MAWPLKCYLNASERDLYVRAFRQGYEHKMPKCETCTQFKPELHASRHGWCRLLNVALPTADFGCTQWNEKQAMTRDQAADQDDPLRHVYLRLYELARHGARRVHDWYFDAAENIDEIPPAGHLQPFDFCPHTDCTLAREAPSDLYVRAFRQGYEQAIKDWENDEHVFTRAGTADKDTTPAAGSTAATDQG